MFSAHSDWLRRVRGHRLIAGSEERVAGASPPRRPRSLPGSAFQVANQVATTLLSQLLVVHESLNTIMNRVNRRLQDRGLLVPDAWGRRCERGDRWRQGFVDEGVRDTGEAGHDAGGDGAFSFTGAGDRAATRLGRCGCDSDARASRGGCHRRPRRTST